MPSAQDFNVAVSVAAQRLGWLTQPRMFWYSATLGLFATTFALGGSWSIAVIFFVGAIVFYVAAFIGGRRTRALSASHYLAVPEYVLEVTDDSITISDVDTSFRIRWVHFDAAFESSTHFVLRHCANAIGVPKRAFSENDLAGVRDVITRHMKVTPLAR